MELLAWRDESPTERSRLAALARMRQRVPRLLAQPKPCLPTIGYTFPPRIGGSL